jgi:16S rRNA (cytosine1402-N4)-methyltransferase
MPLRDVSRAMPSATEVQGNPRSRSAVMRVATRTEVAV